MREDKAYRVIGVYWLVTGLINIPNLDSGFCGRFSHWDWAIREKLTLLYNLLDTPLILLIFFYAAPGRSHKKHLLQVLLLFIALELSLVSWKGYNFISSAMIIGAGLLLVLSYSITGLVQYMKKMEHTPFENSMVFFYAALLFAYGSFTIIYIFIGIHPNNFINNRDSLLLYYISLLLSTVITCIGLWGYGIRRATAMA